MRATPNANPTRHECGTTRLRSRWKIGAGFVVAAAWLGVQLVFSQNGSASSRIQLPPGFSSVPEKSATNVSGYVGNAACLACHQDKAGHDETAHAHTSSIATTATVKGRFTAGANDFRTANPDLYFQLRADASGCTQTAVLRTSATQVLTRTERMDLVIGSGRKGQTYLYWDGEELFQLPVSYWSALGAWVNSPGFIDGRADFERPIARRCLECHASAFVSHAPPENKYERSSLALGLSCEKCHGPGAEHVTRARTASAPHSLENTILNPKKMARDRQIDVCGLCHAGPGNPVTPPMSFRPGDVLSEHIVFEKLDPSAPLDVHASQVQLLERSRCFKSTSTMTCSTCHDVHRPQRDLAAFSVACISCHKVESCGEFPKLSHRIDRECVTCHMPSQKTEQIIIASADRGKLQPEVRNHRIAIYPEARLP